MISEHRFSLTELQLHCRIVQLSETVEYLLEQDERKNAQISNLIDSVAKLTQTHAIREKQIENLVKNLKAFHDNVLECWKGLGVVKEHFNNSELDFKDTVKNMHKAYKTLQTRFNTKFELVDSRLEKLEVKIEYITAGIRDLQI